MGSTFFVDPEVGFEFTSKKLNKTLLVSVGAFLPEEEGNRKKKRVLRQAAERHTHSLMHLKG